MDSRTPLHVFDADAVNAHRYREEILEAYVRLFRGAFGSDFIFKDDNARQHKAQIVDDFLGKEHILLMN